MSVTCLGYSVPQTISISGYAYNPGSMLTILKECELGGSWPEERDAGNRCQDYYAKCAVDQREARRKGMDRWLSGEFPLGGTSMALGFGGDSGCILKIVGCCLSVYSFRVIGHAVEAVQRHLKAAIASLGCISTIQKKTR